MCGGRPRVRTEMVPRSSGGALLTMAGGKGRGLRRAGDQGGGHGEDTTAEHV